MRAASVDDGADGRQGLAPEGRGRGGPGEQVVADVVVDVSEARAPPARRRGSRAQVHWPPGAP